MDGLLVIFNRRTQYQKDPWLIANVITYLHYPGSDRNFQPTNESHAHETREGKFRIKQYNESRK